MWDNNRLEEGYILGVVRQIRRRQPRLGVRKIHYLLPRFGISAGRDRIFELLQRNGLLVDRRRNYRRTTDSYHRFHKHPNLIKDLEVQRPNQVFVSDITYLETQEGFCYLALITDLYSRKIVGWDLSQSLSIDGCQRALRQALRGVADSAGLIHHSDRGIQYCSNGYVDILRNKNIKISMTEENHCYENAVAERINGILKDEFQLGQMLTSYQAADRLTREAVHIYNDERPHCSLNYQTPAQRYAA